MTHLRHARPGLLLLSLALAIGFASAHAQRPGRPPLTLSEWVDPNTTPERLTYVTFYSPVVGEDVSYTVYLPDEYESATERRYPVVYWLHGRGGRQDGARNFAMRLEAAIAAGQAPPMIVIGVNGRRISSWVDAANGQSPVQSMLVHDLIPHVDATYRTIRHRSARAIEGFSMGGAGAPKLGFKFPELFGVVGVMAGALHDYDSYATRGTALQDLYNGSRPYFEANSPWQLVVANADLIRGRTHVRIAVGNEDRLMEKNVAFHELLTELGIAHDFDVLPGVSHNPREVYDALGDKTWDFYRDAFATAQP